MQKLKNTIQGELREDYPLKNLSWFKVGGTAKYFYSPLNTEELEYFIQNIPKNMPIYVLGAGSNTLIRDKGFDGCIIKLKQINNIQLITANDLLVEAGCLNSSVVFFAQKHNFSGVEFLAGIPGTIGGGLAMNAGCFKREMKDIVLSVKVLDCKTNRILNLENKEIKFKYRGNGLEGDVIFLSAVLKGKFAESKEIQTMVTKIKNNKDKRQPKKVLTAGSTFANPNVHTKAWELIDKVGLRGYKIGGASFSEKHCNFLINDGTATSQDIEDLILLAKEKVSQKFNIILKEEIKIIGKQ